MKKLIYILILSISICVAVKSHADESKLSIWGAYSYGNEVSVTPGSTPTNFYLDFICANLRCGNSDSKKSAASFGIDYRAFKNLWFGATATIGGSMSEITKPNSNGIPHLKASYKSYSYFVNIKWMWLKFKKIRLYTRAGFGATTFSDCQVEYVSDYVKKYPHRVELRKTRDTSAKFAWQASILGVEWRPVKWGSVFAEGGLGNQGNLLAGVRVYVL